MTISESYLRYKQEKTFSNPGSGMKIMYQLVLDEDGKEHLKPCGMHDLQAEIQSHHDSVDINNIMARYLAGDDNAIKRVEAFYADVSEIPVSMIDVMNLNMEGKRLFDSLPASQRDIYGNDYVQFVNNPELLVEYLKEKNKAATNIAENSIEEVKNDDKEQ